jgi:hypothetical protein
MAAAYDRRPSMGRQVCTRAREPVHARRRPNRPESDLALELPSTRGEAGRGAAIKMTGMRIAGFTLTRQRPAGKWGRIHICTRKSRRSTSGIGVIGGIAAGDRPKFVSRGSIQRRTIPYAPDALHAFRGLLGSSIFCLSEIPNDFEKNGKE